MTIPNQSTPGSTNVGEMTIGLIDHLLDCLFSNESPNDSLRKRLDTLVHDLELFEPPKIEDTKSLEFINLRAKFERLRTENINKTEAQDDKICATSKSLSDRVIALIERLFSLPKLPEDIWKSHILPLLAPPKLPSPIKQTVGKIQINRQMSKVVKETMLQLLESEQRSLRFTGCSSTDEAINFVIKYKLSLANLKDFPDLTNEHLKTLAEQCPQLKHLLIFSGYVTEVPKFAALQSLDLSRSYSLKDAGLPHLKKLTNLQSLNLDYCENISDAVLAHLKELRILQSLNLIGCKNLTDAGLAHLKEFTALQSLSLGCRLNLKDAGLAHLKELTALQSLNLRGCENLTDAGLAHLKGLTALQSLNLPHCENLTDEGLAHLKGLTALQSLNLPHCENLTDEGLAHLKGLTALQSLNLSGCRNLTGAGLAHLKELRILQSIDLSRCYRLTDAGVAHLKEFTALQSLGLTECDLTDACIAHLKELKALQSLEIYSCYRLTDKGLASLQEFSGIQIFGRYKSKYLNMYSHY